MLGTSISDLCEPMHDVCHCSVEDAVIFWELGIIKRTDGEGGSDLSLGLDKKGKDGSK